MLSSLPCAAILLLPLAMTPLAPDKAKLSAKPGGKMTVEYSSPSWQDAYATRLGPGQTWHLGGSTVAKWTIAGGLVFEDEVVFPGTYDLSAAMEGGGDWTLVFHHDGKPYRQETDEAATRIREVEIEKKDHTKRLLIELNPDEQAGQGHYQIRVTFGPRRMQGHFQSAKAKTAKAKAGKKQVTATWLLRTDLGTLHEKIEWEPTLIASFEVRGREKPLRVYLEGNEEPQLFLAEVGQKPMLGETIAGKVGVVKKPAENFDAELKSGKLLSFVVSIGDQSYHFEIPPEALVAEEE